MSTLRNITNEISLDDSSSAPKAHSPSASSLRADVPKSPSNDRKKIRTKHSAKKLLEEGLKSSAIGLLNLPPKLDRKRMGGKRVTASPGALSPLKRLAGANQDASQAIVTAKSSRKSKTCFDWASESSVGYGDSGGDRSISLSAEGRKRKAADYSDIENEGDGSNDRNERIARKKCIGSSTSGSDNDFDDVELKLAMESSLKESKPTVNKRNAVYDLVSSSEDESSRTARNVAKSRSRRTSTSSACFGDDDDTSKIRRCRSGPGQGGWLTSFHATKSDDSSSSSSEDQNTDRRLKAIDCRNWLTSSSRHKKLKTISKLSNDNDKILQMLLWDIGFDFTLYWYQFEAVRFVAGLVPSFPSEMKNQADADCDSSNSDDSNVEDEAIQEMMKFNEIGRFTRSAALNRGRLKLAGRGMLLADEMGLGKTIEALAGAALRNATKGRKKPTLIITPQDGVQEQWLKSLMTSGVESARIRVEGERKADTKKRGGKIPKTLSLQSIDYVLCTRYKIQSAVRTLFDYNATAELQGNTKASFLFRKVPLTLIKKLRHEYNVDKGKERRDRNMRKEAPQDRLTRLIRESLSSLIHVFETVIIDECHFLSNVLAYWGIGAALLGAQSKRTVLLSGTPYNNGLKDMSALMTFIDPRDKSSQVKWWNKAAAKDIVDTVSNWRNTFMLRREKDILRKMLPPRERSFIDIAAKPSELGIYEWYEDAFIKVLNQLQEEIDDSNRKAQREMFNIMMSCMACMRMSLIHPILPGGREVTIQFSPSRRHLLNKEEKKKECVLCGDKYPMQKADEYAAKTAGEAKEENDDDSLRQLLGVTTRARTDDNIMEDDNDEVVGAMADVEKDKGKGPLVELGSDICGVAGSDCCHFAHERCIELFLEKGCQDCPRCYDLTSRIHVASSTNVTNKKIYCQEIGTTLNGSKGFTASAKIEKAVEWVQKVPKNEKTLILSFFKGSLDLFEGILTEDLSIECCRYDGDVSQERRRRDLDRFKSSKTCRVLLASVQSGGTGLNITEANNVCFLDRWFNPQIHDQAESRCHRIKQTKIVKIAYMDTSYTIDIVMKQVNALKEKNSEVLLANGMSIQRRSSLDYNDLAGVIGNTLKAIIASRHAIIMENAATGNANAPLLSSDDLDLESKLHEAATLRATQKKAAKMEDGSNTDDSDSEDDRLNGETISPMKSARKGNGPSLSNSHGSLSSGDDLINREPIFSVKSERKETEPSNNNKNMDMDGSTHNWKMINGPPLSNCDDSLSSGDELINREPIFCVKSERKATTPTTDNKSMEGSACNCKMPPMQFARKRSGTSPIGIVIDLSNSDEEDEDLLNGCLKSQKINPAVIDKKNVEEDDEDVSRDWTWKIERCAKSGTSSSTISALKGGIFSSTAIGRKYPSQMAVKAKSPFSNDAATGASYMGSSHETFELLSETEDSRARTAAPVNECLEEKWPSPCLDKGITRHHGYPLDSNRQVHTSYGVRDSVHQQASHDTISNTKRNVGFNSSSNMALSVKNSNGDGDSKGPSAMNSIQADNAFATDDDVLSIAALEKELDEAIEVNDFVSVKTIHNRLKKLRGKQK